MFFIYSMSFVNLLNNRFITKLKGKRFLSTSVITDTHSKIACISKLKMFSIVVAMTLNNFVSVEKKTLTYREIDMV